MTQRRDASLYVQCEKGSLDLSTHIPFHDSKLLIDASERFVMLSEFFQSFKFKGYSSVSFGDGSFWWATTFSSDPRALGS